MAIAGKSIWLVIVKGMPVCAIKRSNMHNAEWEQMRTRIAELVRAANEIAEGNLDAAIPRADDDAIGAAFEKMRRRLVEFRDELVSWNGELETRVRAQTAQLERRNAELAALLDLGDIALSSLDLDQLGQPLVRQVMKCLQADGAAVYLYNGRFSLLTAAGAPSDWVEHLNSRIIGRLESASTKDDRPITLVCPTMDESEGQEFRQLGVVTAVVMPLTVGGQLVGALYVHALRLPELPEGAPELPNPWIHTPVFTLVSRFFG